MTPPTHRDTWCCLRCLAEHVRTTEDYDYDVACVLCGKTMRLMSRTRPDDTIPLLDAFADVLRAIPERVR